jgi:hypothetical protein
MEQPLYEAHLFAGSVRIHACRDLKIRARYLYPVRKSAAADLCDTQIDVVPWGFFSISVSSVNIGHVQFGILFKFHLACHVAFLILCVVCGITDVSI